MFHPRSRSNRSRSRLWRWLVVGSSLFAPVAVADWTTAVPVPGPAPLDDRTYFRSFPNSRQNASVHDSIVTLLGPRLVRYTSDGTLLGSATAPLDGSRIDAFEHLVRAPDGRLYARSDSQGMAALESSGAVQWTAYAGGALASPPVFSTDGSLSYVELRFDGDNRPALHLRRLLGDGSQALDRDLLMAQGLGVALEPVYDLQLSRVPGSEDLIVAGNMNFEYAILARLSAQGEARWYWKGPGRLRRYLDASSFAVLANGGVLIATQATDSSDWDIWQLDANGGERLRGAFPAVSGYTGARTFISAQGRVYQFNAASDGSAVVVGRDATGRELWRVARSSSCRSLCNIFPTANGDLWLSGYGAAGYAFERYSPNGVLRFARTAADFSPAVLAGTVLGELDGERMMVALRRQEDSPGAGPPRRYDEWMAFDLGGVAGARATLPALSDVPPNVPAVTRDADGTTILVSAALDDSRDRLERIDVRGQHSDGVDLEARDDLGSVRQIALCGARLCVRHERGVKAYSRRGFDGVAWRTAAGERTDAIHVFADGRLLLQRHRFHPDISDIQIPLLSLHDADGNPLPLPAGIAEGAYVYGFDPEFGALLKTQSGDVRLRSDGSLQTWSDPLDVPGLSDAPPNEQRELVRHHVLPGGDTIVAIPFRRSLDNRSLTQVRTLRLARVKADGRVTWRRDWNEGGRTFDLGILDPTLSVASGGDLLMSTRHGASGAIWLTAIRGTDGEVITRRVHSCQGARCEAADFRAGPEDAVFGVARAGSRLGSQHKVVRIDGMFEGTRLPAQAALSGVWFAPESSGQGVTVQHAADGTLGLAWFTHARANEPQVESLRWYTMSAQLNPGMTEVALPVYTVRGGVFDRPPAVTATVVGQARLWLAECGRMEMRVRFDDDYVVGGTDMRSGGEIAMSLQRVIASTAPCDDGTAVQPPQRNADPQASGVWYEPDTAGQGIFLYRVEATASQTAVMAGAWFTHDPDGSGQPAADSAHWFTLSGDGAQRNGVHVLSIGQTVGGHLGGVATRNSTPVGEAILTPGGCNEMTLSYRFYEVEVARAFRAVEGRIALQRVLGGCGSQAGATSP